MAESVKNVVLIGAGGILGPHILNEFLKNSSFNVTVFSRPVSKSTFPAGVKVVKTDYSPADLAEKFKGHDAVISLVGNDGFQDQQKIIDAAIKAGIKRFVPSEFGCNTGDKRACDIVPVFYAKRAVAEYLQSKEDEGISWTGVITGPFFDWGLEVGFLGFDLKNQTAKIWDGGNGAGNTPVSETSLAQIARAVVAILSPEHLEETKNKYVYVNSHTVTQNEILAALEKVSGKKWTVTGNPKTEEVIPAELEKFSKGDYSSVPPLILSSIYSKSALADLRKLGLWNERLGLPQEDLEEAVKRVLSG